MLNTVFHPRDGGGYRVAGVKQFCSLGDAADYFFITGIQAGKTSARDGVISAMIPGRDAGVKIEGTWNATGMRGTISHTIRYDCAVDPANVVGQPGQYLTIDLQGFALGYAAVYLGIGEAAFEYMTEYARTKIQRPSTEPMSHHPLVQRTVAEVGTQIRAARLLLHEAACVKMAGDREATMLAVNQAKTFAADVGLMATERAMRLAGGRGILKELPLERWHRDSLAGPVMPPVQRPVSRDRGQAPLRAARGHPRVPVGGRRRACDSRCSGASWPRARRPSRASWRASRRPRRVCGHHPRPGPSWKSSRISSTRSARISARVSTWSSTGRTRRGHPSTRRPGSPRAATTTASSGRP